MCVVVRVIIMAETCHVCSSEGNHHGRTQTTLLAHYGTEDILKF